MGVIIFIVFWAFILVFLVLFFYKKGKQILSIFPDISTVNVVYSDNLAIGHLASENKSKFSNVDKSIRIVVTEDELWIYCNPVFAGTIQRHGLLHKVNLKNVTQAKLNGSKVEISFRDSNDKKKKVVAKLKNEAEFLTAVKRRSN